MTDFYFVPTKSHPSDKFTLHKVPRTGHDFARKVLSWVSPSTYITSPPPEGRLHYWQQRNHSENLMLKQVLPALAPGAPFHFALRLGGH